MLKVTEELSTDFLDVSYSVYCTSSCATAAGKDKVFQHSEKGTFSLLLNT